MAAKMEAIRLLLPILLLSVAMVNCQSGYPHVYFMGEVLANHSYVNLSLVGYSDAVKCRTDHSYCCSGTQGVHRGDWYFPDGSRLPFGGDVHESRSEQSVDIRIILHSTSPSGIYRCDIATIAVHDETDPSVRETLYVGLYGSEGS